MFEVGDENQLQGAEMWEVIYGDAGRDGKGVHVRLIRRFPHFVLDPGTEHRAITRDGSVFCSRIQYHVQKQT